MAQGRGHAGPLGALTRVPARPSGSGQRPGVVRCCRFGAMTRLCQVANSGPVRRPWVGESTASRFAKWPNSTRCGPVARRGSGSGEWGRRHVHPAVAALNRKSRQMANSRVNGRPRTATNTAKMAKWPIRVETAPARQWCSATLSASNRATWRLHDLARGIGINPPHGARSAIAWIPNVIRE